MNSDFSIDTPDHPKLCGRHWLPNDGVKAVVCLVHGLGEHCGRYGHVADALNQAGYAVVAIDLRGHGRSGGRRGHARNYDELMADISKLLEKAGELHPGLPVFLYGHSLGGNLVLHHVLSQQPRLAGVIATASLLRLTHEPPAWKTGLLHILNALHIQCPIPSGLDDTALSRDINVVRSYRNDPLTHDRISPSLATAMVRFGQWNIEHASDFPCPLLLMHGDADRITSAEASREFANIAGDRCTLKIWDGFYHEIHNEPGNAEVLGELTNWLDHCL
ncbi:Monoacylglycerol lipase [Pontiella desulfatans]|uniref:Monoacylglycerol lipase n=1 Tax=Pontiella desulfatans TaxID=2750659 RepID=A0A6C2U7N1_PONDE|nr:alpha/beta hydrolase [Pontiella desulfatans]VGO15833.1 Monoacylglycerol lipase [Pontiella desulfatans]